MPYIDKLIRQFFDINLKKDGDWTIKKAGNLNYVITQMVIRYLECAEVKNYQAYNDCIGALECAKLELYRRRVAELEDKKIIEYGDVY